MLRFSDNAATKSYTMDAGFPKTLDTANVETVVFARSATGVRSAPSRVASATTR